MRHVLLTGATGVVGSATAPLFLNEPDTTLWLIVRARDEAELAGRIDRLFAYWGAEAGPGARGRLRTLRGDVGEPRLGLGAADWGALAARLTHIVHSAASVRLDMSEAEARASSIRPVEEILDLAAAAPNFRKLDYVSTLGVAGRLQGLVPEAPLDRVQDFHSTYESSKAEAERLVLARMAGGLPATVHRPSMVVGHSRTGKIIRFQVFYFLARFLSGAETFGLIPRLGDVSVDLVPVDYVAQAIHWSAGAEAGQGRILHLCSGPDLAVPVLQLAAMIRLHADRPLPALRTLPMPLFRALALGASVLAGARTRRGLANLNRFLSYAADRQRFANAETRRLLEGAGLKLPRPGDYLGPVLGYHAATAGRRRNENGGPQGAAVRGG